MSNFNDPSSIPPPPPPVVGVAPGGSVPQTSGKAIASMVLGIVSCISFCMCYGVISITCGILALVFSKQALADSAAGRAGTGGNGMAKAGKICGIVGLCLAVVFWAVMIVIIIVGLASGAGASNSPGFP